MGSWYMNLYDYMGGWCLWKFNSMGGWVKNKVLSSPSRYFFSGIALSLSVAINSFLASGDFCCLLITFAKEFGPRSGPTFLIWIQTIDTDNVPEIIF